MNFLIGIIIATILLIAAIITLSTRFLFPHHRIVALFIYATGWIPFLYSVSLKKDLFLQHKKNFFSFLSMFWVHIIFAIIMIGCLYFFLVLFPIDKSPFMGMKDDVILRKIKEDETIILYLNDQLSENLENAKDKNIFSTNFKNISNKEKKELRNFWISYIENLLTLDVLKNRYKTFYQLNVVTKKTLHKEAFTNGYAAFLFQHYHALQLSNTIKNQHIIDFFNEGLPDYGIEAGIYDLIKNKLTDADELIRLNVGRAYYSFLEDKSLERKDFIKKYLSDIEKTLSVYSHFITEKPGKFLEKNSFNLWFPIQKKLAINISYVKTSTRDYLITHDLIQKYKEIFLPGDILLERREWHATNVGIPGFWTHNALYLGSLAELDDYFKDLAELRGKKFSEFIKENYPKTYERFLEKDEEKNALSVIESKRPGVILTSLEESAGGDSLSVLRVKDITTPDRFKIVSQALSHFGKPYDFDFNFATDSTLVCSELVYKSYIDNNKLSMEMQEFNGRLIISPNQFAEKFAAEYGKENAELELVLFLDGNEKEKAVFEKGAEEFKESWKRPKWHIIYDFVDFR